MSSLRRIHRVNSLLVKHVSVLLQREVSFKEGVLVTVVRADTTPDLRHAKVFVSVLPLTDERYVLMTINKEIGRIQGALNKLLMMKPLPRLSFVSDHTEFNAAVIERILREEGLG